MLLPVYNWAGGVSENATADTAFSVYENTLSAEAEVNINFISANETDVELSIMKDGKVMSLEQYPAFPGNNSYTLDIHEWPEGIYTIRLSVGGRAYDKDIVL